MKTEMKMIYWKSGKFWLGKLKEHPEIMTQGKTLKELEENLRDAYQMMIMEDVPENYREKAIALWKKRSSSRNSKRLDVFFCVLVRGTTSTLTRETVLNNLCRDIRNLTIYSHGTYASTWVSNSFNRVLQPTS